MHQQAWQVQKLAELGSLQLAIHVVQYRHAGEQGTHWNKANKELTSVPLFVLSQCIPLLSYVVVWPSPFFFRLASNAFPEMGKKMRKKKSQEVSEKEAPVTQDDVTRARAIIGRCPIMAHD